MAEEDVDALGEGLLDEEDDDINEDIPNLKKALLNERVSNVCLHGWVAELT